VAIAFEVPVFMLGLVRLRILTAAKLRSTWRFGLRDGGARRHPPRRRPGLDDPFRHSARRAVPAVDRPRVLPEPRWRSDRPAPIPE
jgi:hypothetical protein